MSFVIIAVVFKISESLTLVEGYHLTFGLIKLGFREISVPGHTVFIVAMLFFKTPSMINVNIVVSGIEQLKESLAMRRIE